MDKIIENVQINQVVLPKDIGVDVPYSRDVDYVIFSRVLKEDRVVASYKMYWLLAILDEVILDNKEIEFKKLICRMVAYAWYPIIKFRLSFGKWDNLGKVVDYISHKMDIKPKVSKIDLIEILYNSEDKQLKKMLKDLTYNVPYRFLSPFFEDKIKGEKSKTQKLIEAYSKEDKKCIYEIYKNENKENCIRIRDNWCDYLKHNYKIIQGWTYYKLVCFLQKRNPNVPAIAMKLEPPMDRKLSAQTTIWKKIIKEKGIKDLYTGLEFSPDNCSTYGNISIDHFVPWSFVLHDQMWNLIPTFKNINSKKSDSLLQFNYYKEDLCAMQYEAFSYVVEKNKKDEIEEYRNFLRIPDARAFLEERNFENFAKRYEDGIVPILNIAHNQGFVYNELFQLNKV